MTGPTRGAVVAFTVLALALTGCGSDDEPEGTATSTATPDATEPSDPATTEPSDPATSTVPAPPPPPTPGPTPQAPLVEVARLTGQDTAIALDTGFVEALTNLGLTPAPVGDAAIDGSSLVLPITGGRLAVSDPAAGGPVLAGKVEHRASGLSISAGSTTVELVGLTIDLDTSRIQADVLVEGQKVVRAPVLRLVLDTLLTPTVQGRTVVLDGALVELAEPGAALLNQTFGTDALSEGLLVGVARITVNAS